MIVKYCCDICEGEYDDYYKIKKVRHLHGRYSTKESYDVCSAECGIKAFEKMKRGDK